MEPAPDVPDSVENARVFGRFSSRPSTQAAFLRISISHIGRSRDTHNL